MKPELLPTKPRALPWWTWIAPLFIIEAGDQLSLLFKYSETYSAFYLPTAIGIVLVNWWGPARILPSMFIIGTFNSWFYGIQTVWLWPFFGWVETATVFLSWFLFSYKLKGDSRLSDISQTVLFLSFGLIIPILFEVSLWEMAYIWDGAFSSSLYWERFTRDLLSELIVNFSATLPLLFFLTPKMNSANLLLKSFTPSDTRIRIGKKKSLEIFLIFLTLLLMTFVLPFETFWFVYGLFSLYLAIRFGFGLALLGNTYLFFISYLIPAIYQNLWLKQNFVSNSSFTNTFLGSLLLYTFATLTGRVISDLRIIEEKLHEQNLELKETNEELDRFVYSASHDLSAPLKSIRGIVSVSRFSKNADESKMYFTKIEESALKLETFITEILDYSRNKRTELVIEKIDMKPLCQEILDNLNYMPGFQEIKIQIKNFDDFFLYSDKLRLKIILNNLIANAIKYQKKSNADPSRITISMHRHAESVSIVIEDNGEGIRPEYQPKVFDMFYRATLSTAGSGLGLYIAKEAAEKINGLISVRSEYGVGSTFTLQLKDHIIDTMRSTAD